MLLNDLISNFGFLFISYYDSKVKKTYCYKGYKVICNKGIHYSVKIKVLLASISPSN